MPVYNRAKLVSETLSSIVAAQHKMLKLILVDNGSTDGSLDVCKDWANHHRTATFDIQVLSEPHQGAAIARNRGLSVCETEWVYFFDSDDQMSADFVEKVMGAVTPEMDVLCVPVYQVKKGTATKRAYRHCSEVYVHLLNNMMSTQSMIFRTTFLRQIGGWNESVTTWDDFELGVRTLLSQPRLRWYEEKAFHQIYVHDESLTGPNLSSTKTALVQAMHAVKEDLAQAGTDPSLRKAWKAYYLRCRIYAGLLQKEGDRAGASDFEALARGGTGHVNFSMQTLGALLQVYTACGGRAAWRIALYVLDHSVEK